MSKGESKTDDDTSSTSTTSSSSLSSISASRFFPKEYAEQQWRKASAALKSDPSLMTNQILVMALKHNPPVHVINFMLSVNPKCASIPKQGPTPLQVAVQNSASVAVVRTLIKACPFALVATNPDNSYDPLAYAKRYRSKEKDLIELLSMPLSSWITASSSPTKPVEEDSYKSKPSKPVVSFKSGRGEKQELSNVKLICATVMKGQKRLFKEMAVCKDQVYRGITMCDEYRSQMLQDLEESQRKHFKTQLIALDMKEKAMRAHVKRMENKVLSLQREGLTELQRRLQSFYARMEALEGRSDRRITDLESRLQAEARRNAMYRSATKRLREEIQTPIVFATPFHQQEDVKAPLWPKVQRTKKNKPSKSAKRFGRWGHKLLGE